MQKKESSKGFLPLSIDNDPHFTREVINPTIEWEYTEKEEHIHDWQGFLRIAEDGDYTISAEIDDNGYISIAGQRVVELDGHNGRTTVTGQVSLTAGYHKIVLHHEDLIPLNEKYKNAQVFTPKINDEAMQIYKIMAPVNVMTEKRAREIMGNYNEYNYQKKSSKDIYGDKTLTEDLGKLYGQENYTDSCAIRVSLALRDSRIILPSSDAGHTDNSGNPLYIRARSFAPYFTSNLGEAAYTNAAAAKTSVEYPEVESIVAWTTINTKSGLINHVAFGFNGEGDSKELTYKAANSIWVLYSDLWEPTTVNAL